MAFIEAKYTYYFLGVQVKRLMRSRNISFITETSCSWLYDVFSLQPEDNVTKTSCAKGFPMGNGRAFKVFQKESHSWNHQRDRVGVTQNSFPGITLPPVVITTNTRNSMSAFQITLPYMVHYLWPGNREEGIVFYVGHRLYISVIKSLTARQSCQTHEGRLRMCQGCWRGLLYYTHYTETLLTLMVYWDCM